MLKKIKNMYNKNNNKNNVLVLVPATKCLSLAGASYF